MKKLPATVNPATPAPQLPTVINQAVARLRAMIMAGDLRPGQKLVEADLCRKLSVSRASIREALRILEKERLIQLIPNRGPSVAKLGWKEIEDIHDVWAMLTSEAVYQFVERAARTSQPQADVDAARVRAEADDAIDQLRAPTRCSPRCWTTAATWRSPTSYSLVSRLQFPARAGAALRGLGPPVPARGA
jgi:DNA-binding GntR family transcriptional regulator